LFLQGIEVKKGWAVAEYQLALNFLAFLSLRVAQTVNLFSHPYPKFEFDLNVWGSFAKMSCVSPRPISSKRATHLEAAGREFCFPCNIEYYYGRVFPGGTPQHMDSFTKRHVFKIKELISFCAGGNLLNEKYIGLFPSSNSRVRVVNKRVIDELIIKKRFEIQVGRNVSLMRSESVYIDCYDRALCVIEGPNVNGIGNSVVATTGFIIDLNTAQAMYDHVFGK